MKIELNKLSQCKQNIDLEIAYDAQYSPEIKGLDSVKANGYIFLDHKDQITLELSVEGKILITDARTLNIVPYAFATEFECIINQSDPNDQEYFDKTQNTLDIMPIIWHNIILEVPIAYSVESNRSSMKSGSGWELLEEEKPKIDPRLALLSKLLDDEKE